MFNSIWISITASKWKCHQITSRHHFHNEDDVQTRPRHKRRTKDLELLVWQGPEENGPSKTLYYIQETGVLYHVNDDKEPCNGIPSEEQTKSYTEKKDKMM